MLPGLLLHVDLAQGNGDQPLQRIADRAVLAGQREDAPVVGRVAGPVEEVCAGHRFQRRGQPVDNLEPAALGDVRDGFDERQDHTLGAGDGEAMVPRRGGRRHPSAPRGFGSPRPTSSWAERHLITSGAARIVLLRPGFRRPLPVTDAWAGRIEDGIAPRRGAPGR